MTIAKNLLENLFDLIRKKEKLPENYFIDPGTVCNLRCPLCPTGLGIVKPNKFMSLKNFKKIIDKIPPEKFIGLYNWGEPLLNPDILTMVRYANKKGHYTEISSNLNIKKGAIFFEQLIDSHLDVLILSIDGVTQKTYSKYRVGGNLCLVMNNLKALVEVKKTKKSTTPKIIWRFMVNKFNEHEIKIARAKANNLGIDFSLAKIGLSDDLPDVQFSESVEKRKEFWLSKKRIYLENYYIGKYRLPLYRVRCESLFKNIFIDPQGYVFPCCEVSNRKYAFGNLLKNDLQAVWNNEKYSASRSLFLHKKNSHKAKTICFKCQNYKKISN